MREITTVNGTTVQLADDDRESFTLSKDFDGENVLAVAGHIYRGENMLGFKPTGNPRVAYGPETLRAIADILEGENQ
ncbi:hypothetical protein [Glutamicibacter arilaitensis]|uniref:hypothetical protein n=1 Tax=Glutamicibacter arilaitensis TaxID=256701 RepID=UPI003850188F